MNLNTLRRLEENSTALARVASITAYVIDDLDFTRDGMEAGWVIRTLMLAKEALIEQRRELQGRLWIKSTF